MMKEVRLYLQSIKKMDRESLHVCLGFSLSYSEIKNHLLVIWCIQVCREAEAALFNEHVFNDLRKKVGVIGNTHTTAIAAVEAAHKCQARAIMVVTVSGR